ncbi:MAG: rhodanese-like domain-containing protein [Burkholderiaceae bacterium]
MKTIEAPELAAWLADDARAKPLLLDVREPWEAKLARIEGSELAPMRTIPQRINELDAQRDVVCICHVGARSMHVGMFLARHGFKSVFNLTGGVDAWARQVDPAMATY